jgi:hypothetical protein
MWEEGSKVSEEEVFENTIITISHIFAIFCSYKP